MSRSDAEHPLSIRIGAEVFVITNDAAAWLWLPMLLAANQQSDETDAPSPEGEA